VTADVLQDFLAGKLSDQERRDVERAIKEDPELAQTLELMRARAEVLRTRFGLAAEIPSDWLAILNRWESGSR
jgi:anti-sigma-K factor RskA